VTKKINAKRKFWAFKAELDALGDITNLNV